jgi:hypothetical protein
MEPNKKQINIFVPWNVYDLMLQYKIKSGLTVTGIIRMALMEFLSGKDTSSTSSSTKKVKNGS